MNIHVRIVAALNIFFGLSGAFTFLIVAMMFGGVVSFAIPDAVPRALLGAGTVFTMIFVLLLLGQAFAGYKLFKGSQTARIVVIVLAILGLFSKPWGTVFGIYSLWALLRKQSFPVPTVTAPASASTSTSAPILPDARQGR